MKITYVILHYIVFNETVECIESILKSTNNSIYNSEIVVVDNGSNNGTFEMLKQKYSKNKKIHLIKNEINLGFAKGNNVGFVYAKRVLKSNFIILLNNDVVIEQNDINELIVKKYEEYGYAVLGPDIITLDKCHQNPRTVMNWTSGDLMKFRFKKRVQLILTYLPFTNSFLKINADAFSKEKITKDKKNVQLHGAFLIFSEKYIDKFDGLYNKTFLYMEEDILRLIVEQNKLLMMYTPDIEVYHKEDAATNAISKKTIIKKRNIYKNLLDSSKIYLNLKEKSKQSYLKRVLNKIVKKIKENDYKINENIPDSYLLSLIFIRFSMLIRGVFRFGFKNINKKVFIGKNVILKNKKNIEFGKTITISDNCEIDALSKNGVFFGNNVSIGKNSIIRCTGNINLMGQGFYIGNNSSLADNCFVGSTGGVWIGDNVIGGQNIRFHSSNHNFSKTDILIRKQGTNSKGIYIGNNCWIGSGVVFCDGVTIEDGCVIGANTVVTKNFPANSIIAGVPAKIIGRREE